jgi:hypothetical protein
MHNHRSSTIPPRSTACHVQLIVRGIAVGRLSAGCRSCPLLPQTPRPLLELGPLARTATNEHAANPDRKTSELARHKLGRLTADDPDGYPRVH